MKIFEIRGYIDGGPNDRGILRGYIKAKDKSSAKKTLGINNGFTDVHEISKEIYNQRKKEALKIASLYKY